MRKKCKQNRYFISKVTLKSLLIKKEQILDVQGVTIINKSPYDCYINISSVKE